MKQLKLKNYLLFILMFGIVLSMATNVVAQDEETEDPETEDRDVSVEVNDYDVKITSERVDGDVKDEFTATIDADGDAEMKIEYKTEGSETVEAQLKIVFYEIVEYTDVDADGIYDENADTILQTYTMSDVGYEVIEYTTNDLGAAGTEHVITIIDTNGIFSFVTHLTETFTTLDGTDLKPTALKIDIIINNFDYSDDGSKLALFHKIESTSKVVETEESPDEADGTATDEQAIVGSAGGLFAFYSWYETANVDGSSTDVLSSFEEVSDTEQKLYLNYEHGASIVHDPKLGINIGTDGATGQIPGVLPDISKAVLYGTTFLATMMFLAIPVSVHFYRKRK